MQDVNRGEVAPWVTYGHREGQSKAWPAVHMRGRGLIATFLLRFLRQRTAALQLCALRCALGPAVYHVHGLDQFDLRREQVEPPRMVVGDGLVAIEAERHSNCRRR